eukprot:TRINITY_DN11779_c0_g2_i1.p1 TRINITY_DN11779_c0_g2~~TRINITY_DN11779_c0_g2_i1.p1  ORF type:complete len:514 (+),score=101.25 TRINITY_DN11779_c0_g2_i1:847-2388(+)
MWTLSTGMCELLNSFREVDEEIIPILQVVEIVLQRDSQTGVKRFRLKLSDGVSTTMALCNDHVGDDVFNNIIESGCIIQIDEFIATEARNGQAIMVLTSTSLVSPPISRIDSTMQVGSAVRTKHNSNSRRQQQQQQEVTLLSEILQNIDETAGNKYTIKGTITNRSDLKYWASSDTGCYFWFDIIDSSLATIRGVLFRDAAQTWTELLTRNETYLMTNCFVKNDNAHGPGLHFSRNSQFTKVSERVDIPVQISTIGEIESRQEGTYVNMVGVVQKVLHVDMVRTRATGEEIAKRVIVLSDQTGIVEVTLWGQIATSCELQTKQVLLGKQLKVHRFSGRTSLSYVRNSCMTILPETDPVAKNLINWSNNGGTDMPDPPLEPQISFTGLKELGTGFEGRLFGTITDIKSNSIIYKGCSRCRKKMNSPQCEKCGDTAPRWYFIADVIVVDNSSVKESLVLYDQAICQITGLTADQVSTAPSPLQELKHSILNKQIDFNARRTVEGLQCTRINEVMK